MTPTSGPVRHSLTLRVDLSEVSRARRLVLQLAVEAGFPEERCFDIQVAASEATANAIEHSPPESEVVLEVLVYPDRLEIEVEGRGQFELPAVAGRERAHRGLGLPLMAKLSDHLALYSGPRGGTLVALTFYRPGFADAHADDVTPPSMVELLRENEVVSAILASIGDEVWFADTERRFTLANAAAVGEFGVAASGGLLVEQVVAATEVYRPDMTPRPVEEAPPLRALAGEVVRNQEEVVRTPGSGELRHRVVNAAPVRDAEGGVIGAVATVRDITESKQAEQLLDSVVKNTPASLALWSVPDLRLLVFNPVYQSYAPGKRMEGRTLLEIWPEAPELEEEFRRVAETGEPYEVADRLVRVSRSAGGPLESRHFSYSIVRVPLPGDAGWGLLNTAIETTESRRSELALRESEQRFRLMFEHHSAVMLLLDPATGAIVDGNTAATRFYGYSRDELIALSIHDLNQLPAEEVAAEYQRAAAEERSHFTFPHVAAGGETRWVDVHSAPVEVRGRKLLFSIIQDATERKQAEKALSQSEATLRGILNSATESIWLFTPDGVVLAGNELAFRRLGKTPEQSIGKHMSELGPAGVVKPRLARLRQVAESCQPLEFEDERAGSAFHHTFCPVADDEGRVGCIACFSRDITEHRRSEAEREALLRQERELVEELAAANEELQSQAEELVAQSDELEVQNERLLIFQEQLKESDRLSRALNEVNESLNSTLEFADILRRVVREGAFAIGAERAALELKEEEGWVVQDVLGFTEDLRGLHLTEEDASVATAMYRHCDLLVIEDSRNDVRVNGSTIWRYSIKAALVVPVSLRGDILGSLQFIWASGPRRFTDAEVDFARKLATSLAFALGNAQLHEEQRDIAQRLQAALLDIPDSIAGVKFAHLYRSATQQALIGGDFYDVFEAKDGRIAVLIGDVSGHGVEAARLATLVKDIVHAFAHQFRRPHLVLRETNRLLVEKNLSGFVTAFLGLLDPETGTLVYSSAGHPPPLLSAEGRVERLASPSVPLGVFTDARYRDLQVEIPRGSSLLLYTDGITEARRDGEFFGEARLAEAFGRTLDLPVGELPSALLEEALAFSRGALRDDVALLALNVFGGPVSRLPGAV